MEPLDLDKEWEEYDKSLESIITSTEPWYSRIKAALRTGLDRGYAIGFRNGWKSGRADLRREINDLS